METLILFLAFRIPEIQHVPEFKTLNQSPILILLIHSLNIYSPHNPIYKTSIKLLNSHLLVLITERYKESCIWTTIVIKYKKIIFKIFGMPLRLTFFSVKRLLFYYPDMAKSHFWHNFSKQSFTTKLNIDLQDLSNFFVFYWEEKLDKENLFTTK